MEYAALTIVAALVVLPFVRIEIVYRARIKAIYIAHERAIADINNGNYGWMRHYREIEGDKTWMLFDLRKWTFKQFYPDL